MERYIEMAIEEMKELRQPYVGTHHLFLAYLKENDKKKYEEFKKDVIDVIGRCQKENQVILFTPLLRESIKKSKNIEDVIKLILSDDNSIVYNILLSKGIVNV